MRIDALTEPPPSWRRITLRLTLLLLLLAFSSASLAASKDIQNLLLSLKLHDSQDQNHKHAIQIRGCQDYPYHNNSDQLQYGQQRLFNDLKTGLEQGLVCLSGQDPDIGKLHPYHHQQAYKLMDLLASDKAKSFQCVQDELFAYAIAASPHQQITNQAIRQKFLNSPKLSVLIDTFRVGGILSQKLKPETYEIFYKMDDEEIKQHLTGKPLRLNGVQRFKNLPSLLFHEMVHWLGHLHTNLSPDVTFLYDTCCFGGSDFINDKSVNQNLQTRACDILKDEELWTANAYKKARLWKFKEYNQLKRDIREHY